MSTQQRTNPLFGYGISALIASVAAVIGFIGYAAIFEYSVVGGGILIIVSLALLLLVCVNTDLWEALPD